MPRYITPSDGGNASITRSVQVQRAETIPPNAESPDRPGRGPGATIRPGRFMPDRYGGASKPLRLIDESREGVNVLNVPLIGSGLAMPVNPGPEEAMRWIIRLLRDDSGAIEMEYGLYAAVFAVGAVA